MTILRLLKTFDKIDPLMGLGTNILKGVCSNSPLRLLVTNGVAYQEFMNYLDPIEKKMNDSCDSPPTRDITTT